VYRSILLLTLAALLGLLASPTAASLPSGPSRIQLRRASFDPLTELTPAVSRLTVDTELRIIQLDAAPTSADLARLRAAGMTPLLPIPEHALLVRVASTARLAALPNLRWAGPLDIRFKLAEGLDPQLAAPSGMLDLRVVATPDAAIDRMAAELSAVGMQLHGAAAIPSGPQLRVSAPAALLADLLARDDVVWVEPFLANTIQSDSARGIVGLGSSDMPSWLNGAGQIVAVTDSGLDLQSDLSADFDGRVVRGFSTGEMSPGSSGCGSDWSDRNGHGTHVAGLVAGGGITSQGRFRGMAPSAGLVIQATSSGGSSLDCFPDDDSYLQKSYDAGARVQNGSFGAPTGVSSNSLQYGGYTAQDQMVDDFLWRHPSHLFVVAAGNSGRDTNADAKVDRDSINTPGTAKSVLTVGASENNHQPVTSICNAIRAEDLCYSNFGFNTSPAPLKNDPVSDDPGGLAAFSSRGPTDDGRIKPEIVAPGTNVISTRSHHPVASYEFTFDSDHAYESGTSMSSPLVAGMAVLTRHWLAAERRHSTPSAALIKAMLLSGATDIQPGQYGTGATREIGPGWPGPDAGWGRASLTGTLPLAQDSKLWFAESTGIGLGVVREFPISITAGEPLRVTLVWGDYPGSPIAARALVNNLNLELVEPSTNVVIGNATADMASSCRDLSGYDICNTSESIEIAAPVSGTYLIRVTGAVVSPLASQQPFAVVAHAAAIVDGTLAAPSLAAPAVGSTAAVSLSWSTISGAAYYQLEMGSDVGFSTVLLDLTTTGTTALMIQDVGTFAYRVRACTSGGCGPASNVRTATTTVAPGKAYMPLVLR
jgi:Subtilase family